MQNKVTVFIFIQLAPRATYSQLISQSEQRLLRDSWRQRNLKWFITHTILKNHDNVKQKSWIRWSMLFKSRKCNGLPVVSPELAQIDELRNSSALTPKWSERGSSDTGVRISSNSLYWLSVRQGDISQSRYTIQKNWKCTHFCSCCICFQLLFTFKYMWNFHTWQWTL